MLFEAEKDVLSWYESQERTLTKDFLDKIPWHEVKNHPIPEELLPVIFYMRDVEAFTPVYFEQMMKTPTGREPAIRAFMERWSAEEPLHGDLLNRFLEEAGHSSKPTWKQDIMQEIPSDYLRQVRTHNKIINLIGKAFTPVHMTWGAIGEMSTLAGYQRLWRLAQHPVLEHILRAIGSEESKHYFFYWSVARIHLARSPVRRKLARFIVDKFWSPVGEGTKLRSVTDDVIRRLFSGQEGIEYFDQHVTAMLAKLPGFENSKLPTLRIAEAAT